MRLRCGSCKKQQLATSRHVGKPKYDKSRRNRALPPGILTMVDIVKALSQTWRTLKLTRKSDKEEFMLYLKLVLIGFGIVGAIGFIIYYLASVIELIAGVSNTTSTTSTILFHLLSGVL